METQHIIDLIRSLTPRELEEFDNHIGTHFLHLPSESDPDTWDRSKSYFKVSDAAWESSKEHYRQRARKIRATTWAQKLLPLFRTEAEDPDHCFWKVVRSVCFEYTRHTMFPRPAAELAQHPGVYRLQLRYNMGFFGIVWCIAGFNPDRTKVRLYHVVDGKRRYDYIAADRKVYGKPYSLDTVYTDSSHLNHISESLREHTSQDCK